MRVARAHFTPEGAYVERLTAADDEGRAEWSSVPGGTIPRAHRADRHGRPTGSALSVGPSTEVLQRRAARKLMLKAAKAVRRKARLEWARAMDLAALCARLQSEADARAAPVDAVEVHGLRPGERVVLTYLDPRGTAEAWDEARLHAPERMQTAHGVRLTVRGPEAWEIDALSWQLPSEGGSATAPALVAQRVRSEVHLAPWRPSLTRCRPARSGRMGATRLEPNDPIVAPGHRVERAGHIETRWTAEHGVHPERTFVPDRGPPVDAMFVFDERNALGLRRLGPAGEISLGAAPDVFVRCSESSERRRSGAAHRVTTLVAESRRPSTFVWVHYLQAGEAERIVELDPRAEFNVQGVVRVPIDVAPGATATARLVIQGPSSARSAMRNPTGLL